MKEKSKAPKKIKTYSNISVQNVYGSKIKPRSKNEQPGKIPFTRGIHKGMYRDRLWTMRQYTGFGTADQTNQRFKYLLERGQTGLSMAFDLPTQIGYDADDPH